MSAGASGQVLFSPSHQEPGNIAVRAVANVVLATRLCLLLAPGPCTVGPAALPPDLQLNLSKAKWGVGSSWKGSGLSLAALQLIFYFLPELYIKLTSLIVSTL